jgi:hypothetical protein
MKTGTGLALIAIGAILAFAGPRAGRPARPGRGREP